MTVLDKLHVNCCVNCANEWNESDEAAGIQSAIVRLKAQIEIKRISLYNEKEKNYDENDYINLNFDLNRVCNNGAKLARNFFQPIDRGKKPHE